jgi:hypothetical protein
MGAGRERETQGRLRPEGIEDRCDLDDNKSDREHLGMLRAKMGMRSLWPKQPQIELEAGPFAIRMQSFPSNLSGQRT